MTAKRRRKRVGDEAKRKSVHFQMDAELVRRLNVVLAKKDENKGYFLERMVKAYLDQYDLREAKAKEGEGVAGSLEAGAVMPNDPRVRAIMGEGGA